MSVLSLVKPVTLREAIKNRTREAHVRLEGRMDVEQGNWSRDRYIAFLTGTLAVVGPVESEIADLLESHVSLPVEDRSTDRLHHDLTAVNATPRVPDAIRLPKVTDVPSAFGVAYVIEGSRLGAQIVARILTARLGLAPHQMTYLVPQGAHVGERWKTFCDALDAFGAAAASTVREAACLAAVETFECFEEALEEAGALSRS